MRAAVRQRRRQRWCPACSPASSSAAARASRKRAVDQRPRRRHRPEPQVRLRRRRRQQGRVPRRSSWARSSTACAWCATACKPGEQIVVNGLQRVRPGAPVTAADRCRWIAGPQARPRRPKAGAGRRRRTRRNNDHELLPLLHRPADLRGRAVDHHLRRRPARDLPAADLRVSGRRAAVGGGARPVPRRQPEGDRRDRGRAAGGADQRRREHALHVLAGHRRRRADADRHLQDRHRPRAGRDRRCRTASSARCRACRRRCARSA